MPTGNPISREWVIEALSDREWHTQIELINRAGRFLKPEIAARKYYGETRKNYNDKNKSKDPSTTSPEAAKLGGTKRLLQRALNALLLEGLLEYRGKKNTTSRESRLVGSFCWACKRFQATMTEDGTCGKCPEYCKRCGCVLDDKRDKAVSDVDPDAVFCKKCQKCLRNENIERDRAAKAELRQRDRAAKAELLKAKAELPKPKRSHHKPKPQQSIQKEIEESAPVKLEQPAQEEQLIVEPPVISEYYKVHLRFPSLKQEESAVESVPIAAAPEPLDDDSPTIVYHSTLKRPKKRRKSPVLQQEPEKSTEPEFLPVPAEQTVLAMVPEPISSEPIALAAAVNLPLQVQQETKEPGEIPESQEPSVESPEPSGQETLEESSQEQQEAKEVTEPEPDVIVDPSILTQLFGVDIVRKR